MLVLGGTLWLPVVIAQTAPTPPNHHRLGAFQLVEGNSPARSPGDQRSLDALLQARTVQCSPKVPNCNLQPVRANSVAGMSSLAFTLVSVTRSLQELKDFGRLGGGVVAFCDIDHTRHDRG